MCKTKKKSVIIMQAITVHASMCTAQYVIVEVSEKSCKKVITVHHTQNLRNAIQISYKK